MSESKVSLAHHNKSKDRPARGTPEFEEWVQEKLESDLKRFLVMNIRLNWKSYIKMTPICLKACYAVIQTFIFAPRRARSYRYSIGKAIFGRAAKAFKSH